MPGGCRTGTGTTTLRGVSDTHGPSAQRTVGQLVRQARRARGLSMRRTALLAGLPNNYITRLEADAWHDPSFRRMCRIARALDVELDTLCPDDEPAAAAVEAV